MTTYGTYSIDSVPVPSDIELAAADRANAQARATAAKTYYQSPEYQKLQIENLRYWYEKWRNSGGC